MRISLITCLSLALFVSTLATAEVNAGTPTTGVTTSNPQSGTVAYKDLPKDKFGGLQYSISVEDMQLDNWLVELNSSANTISNRKYSYAKAIKAFKDEHYYLGVRVKFPTHRHNAHARVAPKYQMPAFDAKGYPVNYGFFDPDAVQANANPFKDGATAPKHDEVRKALDQIEGLNAGTTAYHNAEYTMYSAIPRLSGIKTLIDFHDFNTIMRNATGYVNIRYMPAGNTFGVPGVADHEKRASEVGAESGMPVIGYAIDPDNDADTREMRQLVKLGKLFVLKDPTREADAYAQAINNNRGPSIAGRPDDKTPLNPSTVASARLESKISYAGVIHNVGNLKSIAAKVAGRNFRNGVSIRLSDQNQETAEYFLGYLDYLGWRTLQWQNPNYIPADMQEPFRLALYPTEIPFVRFDSFIIYRDGAETGGDFVVYFDWVKVDTELAITAAQLDIDTPDFITIDDESWWKILRDRNSKKTEFLLKRFSEDLDLRRQNLGRSVTSAEGNAAVETSNLTPRRDYKGDGQ